MVRGLEKKTAGEVSRLLDSATGAAVHSSLETRGTVAWLMWFETDHEGQDYEVQVSLNKYCGADRFDVIRHEYAPSGSLRHEDYQKESVDSLEAVKNFRLWAWEALSAKNVSLAF